MDSWYSELLFKIGEKRSIFPVVTLKSVSVKCSRMEHIWSVWFSSSSRVGIMKVQDLTVDVAELPCL